MTDNEFKIFRNLIHDECGIFLNDGKKDFLRARVEKRLNALDFGSFFQYYKYVSEKNRDELCLFIDSVTINETYFFRNLPQFEMLREKILPELIERKRKSKDYTLNIWCAGCATGEEPYSVAMEVHETVSDICLWKVKIIASDISLKCLETASKGEYPAEKLRDTPEKYLKKHFINANGVFQVRDNIKKLVIFDFHNLKHEKGPSNVDIIFCRNVMIYFDEEEQKRLIEKFRRTLNSGGYIFLGHAETLNGLTNGDFRFLYSNKGTAYQKVKGLYE